MGFGIGIGIGWPNASAGISYAKKLIKAFKARVLSYPNSIFEAGPCLEATLEGLNAIGLLDNASLIITPNAYNTGILYDVVPNTTLGDMTVVRATTATRVNSTGLIEVVPRNLLTYSNTFTNAVWANAGYGNIATVIANDIISPDGLMNGSKITFSAGVTQARLIQQTSVINGGIYQASIFVKYGNKNTIDFYCDAAIIGLNATFNFTTKVLTASGVSNTIVTELPNGWFRLQYTYTTPSATSQIGFISNIGEDGFVYAYGGQVEQGSSATEYFPTTTRLNIPRIDYTNGSCPSLLVEPQRTNLKLYSEKYGLAQGWSIGTIGDATVVYTENYGISPDGTQNANRIQINRNTAVYSDYVFFQSITIGTTYTYSFYVKSLNGNKTFKCLFANGENNIVSITEQWQRKVITFTSTTTLCAPRFLCEAGVSSSIDVLAWGMQLEVGSYATSYVPTVASTVTRNADAISKTGISSLIGQTEGTFFLDIKNITNETSYRLFTLSNSTDTSYLVVGYTGLTNKLYIEFVVGSSIINIEQNINKINGNKIAFVYANGIQKIYVDGVNTYLNTLSLGVNNWSVFKSSYKTGTDLFNGTINSIQLYKTALTDTECVALTTI